MVQWLGSTLQCKGLGFSPWSWEDRMPQPAKPLLCNYWACTLEPQLHSERSQNSENPCITMKSSPYSRQLEKIRVQQASPTTTKNKSFFFCNLDSMSPPGADATSLLQPSWPGHKQSSLSTFASWVVEKAKKKKYTQHHYDPFRVHLN